MTCASCVARVEDALAGVPGVVSVAVNLASEKVAVEYAEGTDLAAMHRALAELARLAERRGAPDAGKQRLEATFRRMEIEDALTELKRKIGRED